ncbi:MAG: CotH kinase family protein [Clostridia bacterium]|nr:CotH kinase family protein [Clostridia bacterium]
MKRILILLSILFALSLVLISCGKSECSHVFNDAMCESPKTCVFCGESEGAPLGHSFKDATCQAPKTCLTCGKTEGTLGEHTWQNATCQAPKTCASCGEIDGEKLKHNWTAAVCTKDKECKDCGLKEAAKEHTWNTGKCEVLRFCVDCDFVGGKVSHDWQEASCTSPKVCNICGEIDGEALGHDWKITSCKNPKMCQRCGAASTVGLPHNWVYKGCDKPRECSVCLRSEGTAFGHSWIDATCVNAKYCENCKKTDGKPLPHEWQEATCLVAKHCVSCKTTVGSPLGHNLKLTERVEPLCEDGWESYYCDRCDASSQVILEAKYGYHICDVDGLCTQCKKAFNTGEMILESVLINNEHAVECCGLFSSMQTETKIYKSVTYEDVGMPVIDLGGSLPTSKGYTNKVEFVYTSQDKSFTCTAEIKVQGASSAGFPKKNFNIKLFNEDGTKNKVKLVDGWGKESKYCLKANYIDYSQSRNVVSGKIFGEIVKSRKDELVDTPNGGAIDGFPILVYNNGVYQGLYTLNIPKDNWMFDMKHSDEKNQAMFMAETWNNAVSFRDVSTSGFVLEFASNEDSLVDNNTQWAYDSLLDLIRFVYNNDGEDFKNGIHEYADVDKCIDSMLYTFFICADDNTSKNILWVTLDGKVWFSSMYDMDGTWGMRWNGRIEFNEYTHPISALVDGKGLAPERNHNNLNLLWEKIYINYYDRVCERYWELREEILTVENISMHFVEFFNAIPNVVREAEKQKWTGVPTQNIDHLDQILTFAKKRLAVMDKILVPEN